MKDVHIYLVDDHQEILESLGDLLQLQGCEVTRFASALAFWNAMPCQVPAVLLLDVRMPGMSGVELQDKLHAQGQQIPIVFMSGESHATEIVQAMKGQPVDFLCKPFDPGRLLEAVGRASLLALQGVAHARKMDELSAIWIRLSLKEREVLPWLLGGHTNKSIADQMDIQADTVKKHRANVFHKWGVADLPGLLLKLKGVDLQALDAWARTLAEREAMGQMQALCPEDGSGL